MKFFEGALQYETLKITPLPELFDLLESAEEIAAEQKRELEKHGK